MTTFNFMFSRLFSKNRHPEKLNCPFFFSPQKLVRLFPLKEVKPSSYWFLIKFLTFDNFKSRLSLIVRVNVVLNWTVVVDSD